MFTQNMFLTPFNLFLMVGITLWFSYVNDDTANQVRNRFIIVNIVWLIIVLCFG